MRDSFEQAIYCSVGWFTECVDHLVLPLLQRDVEGSVLLDLMSKWESPVRGTQKKLSSSLRCDLSLRIAAQFRITEDQQGLLFDKIRGMVVQMSVEIWYRVDLYFIFVSYG